MENTFDIYEAVTKRIIENMEKGIIPWKKPWGGILGAVKHASGKPYSLINQLLLGCEGEWATFNEVSKAGGHVKKGASGHMVVFWKMYETDLKDKNGNVVYDKDGNPVKKTIPVLRYFNVFNIETDCEGIKPKYKHDETLKANETNAKAESIIADYVKRSGLTLNIEKSDHAFYRPSTDTVVVPMLDQFEDAGEYYSTVFHELAHSTGAENRLNRLEGGKFGSETYSKEELVAEITASAILNYIGIESKATFDNNTAYIQDWIEVLKNDKCMIVSASAKAEKAFKFILGATKSEVEAA